MEPPEADFPRVLSQTGEKFEKTLWVTFPHSVRMTQYLWGIAGVVIYNQQLVSGLAGLMIADLRAFRQDNLSFRKDASNITFFLPLVLPAGQNLVYMLGYILW